MAITQTQALPAPFITALGEKYGAGLAGLVDQPFTTAQLGQVAPQVAAQTGLQQQATGLATAGLGAYQPYLTGAATATQAPGAAPLGLEAYGTYRNRSRSCRCYGIPCFLYVSLSITSY